MQNDPNQIKSFLPSKKFVSIIAVCLGIIVLILILSEIFQVRSQFQTDKNKVIVENSSTLYELANQDSNNNSIPDWEESLYSLDPRGDGIVNKKLIDAKKLAAQAETGYEPPAGDATITETGQFSRTLLTSLLSLNQSGKLTPEAVNTLTNTIDQTLREKRDATSTYKLADLTTTEKTDSATKIAYIKKYNAALKKATDAGAGTDIGIVNDILKKTYTDETFAKIDVLSIVYSNFAKDLLAIKTPNEIATKALSLANNSVLISKGLQKIEATRSDALTAMIGFDEYGSATDAFNQSLIDIDAYFEKNIQ